MKTEKPIVRLVQGIHRNMNVVFIRFKFNEAVAALVKPLGAIYSKTNKCWYIPRSVFKFDDFKSRLENDVNIVFSPKKKDREKEAEVKPQKETFQLGNNKTVRFETNVKEGIIYIRFVYDPKVVNDLRRLQRSWYHPGAKVWSVPNTEDHREEIGLIFKTWNYTIIEKNTEELFERVQSYKKKPQINLVPQKYIQQLILENKSQRTIEIYSSFLNQYINHFKPLPPDSILIDDIRAYILYQREVLGYSTSYQNQLISTLKSFYRVMYKRELNYDAIPRPKKARTLPKVIAKQQIEKMIGLQTNLKHRLILAMLYGCGLRLNELISLEIKHINYNNNSILIVCGKGRKDRRIPLPKSILPLLQKYIKSYLPEKYLFNGTTQIKYSNTSVQHVVKNAAIAAGIPIKVTPHTLRHCYATHMLEKGVDLRYIQELLGHQSSKTTEIYTHVSNRQLNELGNPLDDISF